MVNPAYAPLGAYLTRDCLETSSADDVSFRALPGAPGDLRGYAGLEEAVSYYFARHPRAGQVVVRR